MRCCAAALTILVAGAWCSPARAQVFGCASLDRANRQLSGSLVDHTHNHGADRRIYSPILGRPRDMYVYVPPGYTPAKAYPLILYFHTAYVDEHSFVGTKWVTELDDMIVAGCIPPVVVAVIDGTIDGRNHIQSPHSFYINGCFGRFEDFVLLEILPFMRSNYSIRTEREALAILGASAGGFGAMSIAIRHRDMFGAVATMGSPLNLRYSNVDREYRENFDPATYRWKTDYDPYEIVAVFYAGLSRTRAQKFMQPVFGSGNGVVGNVIRNNPADLLFTTNLRPGELAIYVNYGGRDNWNFDAQGESFVWLARQRGIAVTVESDPHARHDLAYFHKSNRQAFFWLGHHLLPPTPRFAAN